MAAEAQRAPCVAREQTIAAIAAPAQLADVTAGATAALRIFATIPPRHGAIAAAHDSSIIRQGEVAVYAEGSIDDEGLIEGQIYAVEYQSPAHGMPMHLFATLPGARMTVRRALVILRKHDAGKRLWWLHPLRDVRGRTFVVSDGPYSDADVASKLLGRVVGIYNPAAIAGAAQ